MLRWWALCDYKPEGINEYGLTYKLKCGQTGLAKKILEDAISTKNIACRYSTPVSDIKEQSGGVTVITRDGSSYAAKKVICTIPLNVLESIHFTPSLPEEKIKAFQEKQIDMAPKIHAEVLGTEHKSWAGLTWPGQGLLYGYGDGVTPKGNTHITFFGAYETRLRGEEVYDLQSIKEAIYAFRDDLDIQRIVSHQHIIPLAKSLSLLGLPQLGNG